VAVYDKTGFPLLFNFFYDILQLSSGRDKVCAFIQNGAKFASGSAGSARLGVLLHLPWHRATHSAMGER
jgi:hypothetical protein